MYIHSVKRIYNNNKGFNMKYVLYEYIIYEILCYLVTTLYTHTSYDNICSRLYTVRIFICMFALNTERQEVQGKNMSKILLKRNSSVNHLNKVSMLLNFNEQYTVLREMVYTQRVVLKNEMHITFIYILFFSLSCSTNKNSKKQ